VKTEKNLNAYIHTSHNLCIIKRYKRPEKGAALFVVRKFWAFADGQREVK